MANRKLLFLIVLTVVVLVGLAGYGDLPEVGRRLAHFPVTYLLAALGLASLNYCLRFLRWTYYLRVLRISVPLPVSCLVFLSGLAMSVTPAKAGELLKCYLLRDRAGVPVANSVPVVIMERLTDVFSVVILGLTGLALLPLSVVAVMAAALVFCGVLTAVVVSTRGSRLFELPVLRRWKNQWVTSHQGLRNLAAPSVAVIAIVLGAAAWFSEGLALWVVLKGLGAEIDLVKALPIYAAATLIGAATALPGGLIGTEGSMVALLQQSGVARGAASAGTLLVRLVTLWFAVAIGLVALAWVNRLRLVDSQSSTTGESEGPALQAHQ